MTINVTNLKNTLNDENCKETIKSKKTISKEFSIKVVQNWVPQDYYEKVNEKILNVKFTPDIFQKQAFYLLSNHQSVFIAAHTSAGKTLIAEYAIANAQQIGNRVIYTSPIKALSNQKFYDFKQKFNDVGLITGDIQINTNSQCLIMTTEILRNLVYKSSDLLLNTEYIVFDEIHYINDPDRGVVWEEVLIMLPKHITIIMLSATIPNAIEFAEWVGRTRDQSIYVIYTNKRPVPLEFCIYNKSTVYAINNVAKTKKNNEKNYSNFREELPVYNKKIITGERFRINDLSNFVINRRLVPAIFFCFSKRACEEYGRSLQSFDATNVLEKKKIQKFLGNAMSALNESDAYLPQVLNMKNQVIRGIGVHHGGLLPFVKECVELLFSQNLIKILIATETFAMGVNMPAKCCVFLNITKIDNKSFRVLTGSEFIQMSGRAGRRGMDKVGTVIIADTRNLSSDVVKKLITGSSYDLSSQFKLSFSLILMALRSNINVEDIMRTSFKEHNTQKNLINDMKLLDNLEKIQELNCNKCRDFEKLLKQIIFICEENWKLLKTTIKKNDKIMLKNNSIVVVKETKPDGLEVEKIKDDDNLIIKNTTYLFKKKIDKSNNKHDITIKKLKENHICIKKNIYLEYPVTCICEGKSGYINYQDIFARVENQDIVFEHGANDIQFVSKIMELKNVFKDIENNNCFDCLLFDSHYYNAIEDYEIKNMKIMITNKYDKKSLIQINEYLSRIAFLKNRGFYDNFITLKGRVAAEIVTVNEVLVTEMVFNNMFHDFDAASLISIFSSMIYQSSEEKKEIEFEDDLNEKIEMFKKYYNELNDEIVKIGILPMELLNFEMAGAVYDWCQNKNLGTIIRIHNIKQEGAFVRLILRLDECCREMINVAILIKDEVLEKKFKEASEKMKRDIVFMPSLYV